MSDLKNELFQLGFCEVTSYLNSGNVSFSCNIQSADEVKKTVNKMITDKFGLSVPVYVTTKNKLNEILKNAPCWWGTDNKDTYDNLIFILSDDTPADICNLIGKPSLNLEKIEIFENTVFWSFDRKNYRKCNWWKKTAMNGIAEKLTVRTVGTIRKICN